MKKYTLYVVLTVLALGLTGCGQEQGEIPELLEPAGVKVDTVTVERDDIFEIAAYRAEVLPYVEEVHFEVDGRLKEMHVSLGEVVEAGQVLASLDDESLAKKIDSLEEQIEDTIMQGECSDAQAKNEINIAKVELDRMKHNGTAWKNCYSKELQIERKEVDLRQEQELRSLKLEELSKQLMSARAEAENATLTAPVSGEVVYIGSQKNGDSIKAFAPVICIADKEKVRIESEFISEDEIKEADKVWARILDREYEVTYIPYESSEYFSKVLSGEELRSTFALEEETLPECGNFAAILVRSQYKKDCLTIPFHALNRDQNGYYAYKMVNGNREQCYLEVGIITSVEAEILSGLEEGDEVLLSEQMLMSEDANYQTSEVKAKDYCKEITSPATVVYPAFEELSLETEARIKEIHVQAGDEVKAGDVLLSYEFDKSEAEFENLRLNLQRKQESYMAELAQRQKVIREMQADALEMTDTYQYEITMLQIEKQKIAYDLYVYQAGKELEELQESVAKAEEDRNRNILQAPFDGIIQEIYMEEGDLVTSGTVLMKLCDTDELLVKVSNGEKLLYNMNVTVEIGRGSKYAPYEGRVVSAPAGLPEEISETSAYIKLVEKVPREDLKWSTVKCFSKAEYLKDVIVVDSNVLERESGKTYVYLLKEEKIQKQYVVEGFSGSSDVWILDGLTPGQALVLD